jgi:hypothetical protein
MVNSDRGRHRRVAVALAGAALVLTVLAVTPLAAGGSTAPKAKSGDLTAVRNDQAAAPAAKRGPRGPRGPRGRRGPAGPAGAQGPAGATNVTSVSFTQSVGPTAGAWAWRACPAGARATGGGARSDNVNISMYESYPVNANGGVLADGETPAGWKVGVWNYASTALPFTVYVICAAP